MAWICPHCERTLKNANAWHYCGQKDLDELFEGKPEILSLLFDKILGEVYEWQGVTVSATKNCVVFVSSQTFLVIRPMKTCLNIKFYLEEHSEHPSIFKVENYNKRLEHHIRITDLEDITPVLFRFIKESYQLLTTQKP